MYVHIPAHANSVMHVVHVHMCMKDDHLFTVILLVYIV